MPKNLKTNMRVYTLKARITRYWFLAIDSPTFTRELPDIALSIPVSDSHTQNAYSLVTRTLATRYSWVASCYSRSVLYFPFGPILCAEWEFPLLVSFVTLVLHESAQKMKNSAPRRSSAKWKIALRNDLWNNWWWFITELDKVAHRVSKKVSIV